MNNSIFIVVGRLGDFLVLSKSLPVLESKLFSKVYIFKEKEGFAIHGAEYVVLPKFITNIKLPFVKQLARIIFEPLQLIYYSLKLKPKIIHGYFTIPKGINSLLASKLTSTKCVVSVIGGKDEIETSLFNSKLGKSFIIWFLRKVDIVTTKGEKDTEYLHRHGLNKIVIFNGAIDINRFRYNGEMKDIDIIFAGYFDEAKGPQRALEIISILVKKLPNLKACFIGKGPLFDTIVKEAKYLNLLDNISFTGFVIDPNNYFVRSSILLFPSANEGLSTAMLEAMACRCVPITSDVGNQTEAAIHNHNSIVINDFRDISAFVTACVNLLSDKTLLNKLATNAENTILSKYSPSKQGEICKRFYESLLCS